MSGIESWSTTPANNNQTPPFGWPAGILPSQVEPIGRQMMTSLAAWYQAAEWINYNFTPTYVSATQFTLPGNVTPTFHVGRRVQATDGATSVYGTITVSAFTTLTTVTVVWDTGVLQTGVTIVYVGITSSINTSAPGAGSVNVTSATVPANGIYLPSANTLGFSSNTTARGSINATGNWNIAAPGSGVALTVNCLENTGAILQGGTPTNGFRVTFADTSATRGLVGYGASTVTGGALTDFGFTSIGAAFISVNGGASKQFSISAAGAITVAAPTSGRAAFNAASGNYALEAIGNSGAGNSLGMLTTAGTNSSDVSFQASSFAGTPYFQVRGDGVVLGRGATAAALVDMTPDTGTFTGTFTGFTPGSLTATVTWARMGKLVMLTIPIVTGNASGTSFTMTGLPAAIQPATLTQQVPIANPAIEDNTTVATFPVSAKVTAASGTINFYANTNPTGWTNGGAKGFVAAATIYYLLN